MNDPSSIRQRRYSSEDFYRKSSSTIQSDHFNNNQNIEELHEIISNQNKFIQQLQIRVRINSPNTIQTSTSDNLIEQNKVN